MKRCCILLAMVFATLTHAFAQFQITGRIVDHDNNENVAFVNVGLFRQSDTAFIAGTASNDQGAFVLQGIPKGLMTLRISAIGYELFQQELDVNGNLNLGVLKLRTGTARLDEVVVAGTRPLFSVEGEKTLYNTAEDPSIQTGTASDALQNAPGVEVDVEGNITLRGASSVEIWINDQPSNMNEENLKTYIQSLPANAIDRIEVITNPSARYGSDADGIINIVTNAKIQRNEFYSFGLNASTKPFVSPWFSYVYANDKLSINLYVNGRYSHSYGTSWSESTSFADGLAGTLDTASYTLFNADYSNRDMGGGAFANFSYQFDENNSLNGWMGVMPHWNNSENDNNTYRREYIYQIGEYQYNTSNYATSSSNNVNGGLFYRHRFNDRGHQLSFSVNGRGGANKNTTDWSREFTAPVPYSRTKQNRSQTTDPSVSADFNYVYPYSRTGELSMGMTSRYNRRTSSNVVDTLAGGLMVNDIMRSNAYQSFTNTNQVYFTLQRRFGDFTVKPGIRFENYNTGISYQPEGCYPMADTSNFTHSYFNVLPTLHLSYRTRSMHTFRASYTMRVNDPRANELTTYITYDEESFSTGNPLLASVYTHSFELGWNKYWNSFGSVGLSGYYRGRSNEINNVSVACYDDFFGRYVNFSQPVNLGSSFDAGVEANVTYRPTGFFNMRLYANGYYSMIETMYNGELVRQQMPSYSVRLNLWTKLWNRLEIHAQGYYRSKTQSLFSTRDPRFGLNGGMRADFFDRKLSVYLNVQDIFNSNRQGSENNSPNLHTTMSSKFNSRSISLGVTFRFGKMELEQQAKEGSEDSGMEDQE